MSLWVLITILFALPAQAQTPVQPAPRAVGAVPSEVAREAALQLEKTRPSPESFAHLSRVSDSSIPLLGRGFGSRATGEIFSLACVGRAAADDLRGRCQWLRFAYWQPLTHELYLLGDPFGAIDESELRVRLGAISKEFKSWRKHTRDNMKAVKTGLGLTGAFWIGTPAVAGSLNGGIIVLTPLTGGIMIGGAALAFVATILIASDVISFESVLTGGRITQAVRDQQGWNWASEPHWVSGKKFAVFRLYAERKLAFSYGAATAGVERPALPWAGVPTPRRIERYLRRY